MVAPVKAGDILAEKYCVERILGIGGMGVVVAAEHVALHQKVALKFMLPEALADDTAVERFMREARAAVRLRSEHVARVMDVGCMKNGAPYIVMEFLQGEDMEELLRKEAPMAPALAVDFILQACMAMAEAHSIGIVHRDLKPANLFITQRPDGSRQVKVLDFGISKVQESEQEVSQTKSSMAMGSPGYMAPEQMRSAKHADHRADIWALGTILYKMLSNQLPFFAESAPEMFAAVLTGESTPLPSVLPSVDPVLAEVVHRCLERDRELRYNSISEFAQALAPFGNERAWQMASSIANVGVAADVATRPASHHGLAPGTPTPAPAPAPVPAHHHDANPATADAAPTVGMPGTGSGPPQPQLPQAAPLPAPQAAPLPAPQAVPLPPTHLSTSQPPAPANYGDNPLTTGRASSGQAVVAAPATEAAQETGRRKLGLIIGVAAAAILALGATQLLGGEKNAPTEASASQEAAALESAPLKATTLEAARLKAAKAAKAARPPIDAGVPVPKHDPAAAAVPADAAPVVEIAPDAAAKRRPRGRPSRPRTSKPPVAKPTPAVPKPKPPVQAKPKPDDDPFGTMQ